MARQPKNKLLSFKILRILRPWHRRLGLFSVLFVVLLAITGVLINHSDDFNLDKTTVKQAWLLDYYGIQAPEYSVSFVPPNLESSVSLPILHATDNLLWQNDSLILEATNKVLSAVNFQSMIVAIDDRQLYLLNLQGQLQETQNTSTGLPTSLVALGVSANKLFLKTHQGVYQSDENLIEWHLTDDSNVQWIATNSTVSKDVILASRSANLHWERVILDLHSGRLFGSLTVWIWDLFAFALLLVSFSGCWIWLKQKPSKN